MFSYLMHAYNVSLLIGTLLAIYSSVTSNERTNEMKKYTLSFADAISHKPEHADRTARKPLGWDVQFQVWPNRASMAKTIRMQQSGENFAKAWKPCVPLTDGEGY